MHSLGDGRELTKEEVQERRNELLPIVLDTIRRVDEVEEGYVLVFESDDKEAALVSEWMLMERICNPFLRFQLSFESNNGPVSLQLSGRSGTKDFLQSEFSLRRWLQ